MPAKWIEAITGSIEQKKQYKMHVGRIEALAEPHRSAAKACSRYFLYYGAISDGDLLITMMGDHADLWESAVADGTPVRDVVGDDPVEFAEAFVRAYAGKEWIDKERERLRDAVDAATRVRNTETDS
nr:DUF1048 domain-containing protein [Rhodococcus sp. (in: high G+C Gram-positive bacteria)]